VVCTNRKARYDYFIIENHEAGIELKGSEVKSLRDNMANLKDGYAGIERGEIFLYNVHISPYGPASRDNANPTRKRKLLLHRDTIDKITGKVEKTGLTLVPLSIYFKNGWAKVDIALAKGKKAYDRREDIKKRDVEREMKRDISGRY
jgi:SsrA-binding protein